MPLLSVLIQVEELQPAYSKLNYVYLAKVSTGNTGFYVLQDLTRTKQFLDCICSFLWQCYKDLAQRDKAREMCEAACSMNADSKEVDLITGHLQCRIQVCLLLAGLTLQAIVGEITSSPVRKFVVALMSDYNDKG